jgi:hypothetical protein
LGAFGGGVLSPVAYAAAAAVTTWLVGAAYENLFPPAAAALEADRAAIVCEIVSGDHEALATEIEAIVGSTMWTLFFRWFDYEGIVSIIVTGETPNGDNLTVNRGEVCVCGLDYSFVTEITSSDIENDNVGWASVGGATRIQQSAGSCANEWVINLTAGDDPTWTPSSCATREGYTLPGSYEAYLVRAEGDICYMANQIGFQTYIAGPTQKEVEPYTTAGQKQWDPPLAGTYDCAFFRLQGSGGGGGSLRSLTLYWKIVAT